MAVWLNAPYMMTATDLTGLMGLTGLTALVALASWLPCRATQKQAPGLPEACFLAISKFETLAISCSSF